MNLYEAFENFIKTVFDQPNLKRLGGGYKDGAISLAFVSFSAGAIYGSMDENDTDTDTDTDTILHFTAPLDIDTVIDEDN